MTEYAEFREAWKRHEVVRSLGERKQFLNARVDHRTLDHTDLWPVPHNGARMVMWRRPTWRRASGSSSCGRSP
ncbi:hypothetical protein [Streptomyces chiangmaiensis]|uniref:Uncharacterized protein n=1 Tax=Streptomyces chiangmaiensis TaxID=766497 RepID=A0ABU7FJW2_9ACTN|nr:hypothetical protein [Streptomyces chiangmaiensis]MED7824399.1 hypothetical protein [Streptomyces chiangmaiensis]